LGRCTLKKVDYFTDAQLGTVTWKIINGGTLKHMKLIRKEDHKELSTDLKESSVISNVMDDFPPICKQDPLEVRVMYMKEYFEMTGQTIKIIDIPDEMYGGALPIAKSRKSYKRKMTEAECLDDTPEQVAKIAKVTASQSFPSASDELSIQQEAQELDASKVLVKRTRSKKQEESAQPSKKKKKMAIQKLRQASMAAEEEEEEAVATPPMTRGLPNVSNPVDLIEVESGTSSSHLSSDSSELDDLTLSLIRKITKTPEKATKSVPKKIDLVNQQPLKPTHQTNPEPTPIQTQTLTSTKQMIIPEHVVESVAEVSVQVTESETAVSIPDPEPTQNLPFTTTDQPSSSSSPSFQNLEQPPSNLLKFEFIEVEMLEISKAMQNLEQLRKSPTLSVCYEEQWASLKTKASDLLNAVSKKCIKIQAAAVKHHLSVVHSAEEGQAPLLYLANTPFFPESDYVSREAKMFKLLKQKILKQQEDAKAREDLLLQRQQALEDTHKQQAALITKLMNKETNP